MDKEAVAFDQSAYRDRYYALLRAKNYAALDAFLAESAALYDTYPLFHYEMGHHYRVRGELAQKSHRDAQVIRQHQSRAFTHFARASDLDVNGARFALYAMLLGEQLDAADMLKYAHRLVTLEQKNTKNWHRLASIYLTQGDEVSALKCFANIVLLDPADYRAKGILHAFEWNKSLTGELDLTPLEPAPVRPAAKEAFDKEAFRDRYFGLKDARALKALDAYLVGCERRYTGNPQLYNEIGNHYRAMASWAKKTDKASPQPLFQRAFDYFAKAADLDEFELAYAVNAMLTAKELGCPEGIKYARHVVREETGNGINWLHFGEILLAQKDKARASICFANAARLRPNNEKVLSALEAVGCAWPTSGRLDLSPLTPV